MRSDNRFDSGVFGRNVKYVLFKGQRILSSLPVRPEAVFSAKLTVVYLNDLIVGSVFLIPLLVSYVVGVIQGGATLPMYFYFMIPVATLTIPVVPLAIISVLSFPMVKIVSYFKNKAIVTLVLSVVMFLGFFAIYMVLSDISINSWVRARRKFCRKPLRI